MGSQTSIVDVYASFLAYRKQETRRSSLFFAALLIFAVVTGWFTEKWGETIAAAHVCVIAICVMQFQYWLTKSRMNSGEYGTNASEVRELVEHIQRMRKK